MYVITGNLRLTFLLKEIYFLSLLLKCHIEIAICLLECFMPHLVFRFYDSWSNFSWRKVSEINNQSPIKNRHIFAKTFNWKLSWANYLVNVLNFLKDLQNHSLNCFDSSRFNCDFLLIYCLSIFNFFAAAFHFYFIFF